MKTTRSFIPSSSWLLGDCIRFHLANKQLLPVIDGNLLSRKQAEDLKRLLSNYLLQFTSAEIKSINNKNQLIKARRRSSLLKENEKTHDVNIYLMKNDKGLIKIGLTSSHPTFREKTLQSQEPDVSLVMYFCGTRNDEKFLHQHFASKRIRGEWFSLSEQDIQWIQERYTKKPQKQNDNLPRLPKVVRLIPQNDTQNDNEKRTNTGSRKGNRRHARGDFGG